MRMPRVIDNFERATHLRPTRACKLLGLAYSTYMGYREGVRVIPDYVLLHIDTLLRLPPAVLAEITEERSG